MEILALFAALSVVSGFDYTGPNGPAMWYKDSDTCGGKHQSPINLDPSIARHTTTASPLRLYNYSPLSPWKGSLTNNGHAAQVNCEMQRLRPGAKGGPLKEEYSLAQYHFHWGPNNSVGSEHTVSNEGRSMEVHLVHFKKSYGSVDEAVKHADGLAVIGFFLEVVPKANDPDFDKLTQLLAQVVEEKASVAVPFQTATRWFFKQFSSVGYFTYQGSLTTPPCSEVVTWIVFGRSIAINSEQVARFRQLKANGKPLVINYRPPQPLNGRLLYYV